MKNGLNIQPNIKPSNKKVILIILVILIVVSIIVGLVGNAIKQSSQAQYSENPDTEMQIGEKPIIYLYPEQETEVSIKLGHPEKLITTYPSYRDGWQVLAKPSGDLVDLATNRSLYALYWEGRSYPAQIHDTGFVIKGGDTAEFLEEKLAILGLNEREANEFIIYWLPKMEHNAYNYIYFATGEEVEQYMPLSVEPAPTTVIRVMMEFKPLDDYISVREQELDVATRSGFTVVEWGGSAIVN